MRVGAWPFCDNAADRAIEKHAACAAAISSSGFVPGPSAKRELYEYLPSKAPLPSLSVPAPFFRSPRHSASEIRFAIVHSIRKENRAVSGDARRDAHDQLAEIPPVEHADKGFRC